MIWYKTGSGRKKIRLINADNLIQEFEKNIEIYEGDEYEEGINTGIRWCKEDVVNATTVNAIPIEWIEKKLLSCQYEYENDYDKGFDKGWNCVIKTLLKDWEKENE